MIRSPRAAGVTPGDVGWVSPSIPGENIPIPPGDDAP